jgi:hypothetical protein
LEAPCIYFVAMSEPFKLDDTYARLIILWQNHNSFASCSLGVTLIGVIFAAALWGGTHTCPSCVSSPHSDTYIQVSCVQVWFYFNNYPKDAWYIKLLVCALPILNICTSRAFHRWLLFWSPTPLTKFWFPIQVCRLVRAERRTRWSNCCSSLLICDHQLWKCGAAGQYHLVSPALEARSH